MPKTNYYSLQQDIPPRKYLIRLIEGKEIFE